MNFLYIFFDIFLLVMISDVILINLNIVCLFNLNKNIDEKFVCNGKFQQSIECCIQEEQKVSYSIEEQIDVIDSEMVEVFNVGDQFGKKLIQCVCYFC